MAVTVSQLTAKISVQGADSAKSQLSSVGQASDSLGDKLKNSIGSSFSLVADLAGQGLKFLGDQMLESVQDAIQHQAVLQQTVQALQSTKDASGETASSIEALADKFAGLTDFSNDTIESGENLLLTFTGIGKQTFPLATQALLDMSQAMGEDTKSAAIQLGKALNDPTQGLTALTRVGVTFTDSQKQAIQQMQAAGNTAGAQKIMLQELEREFGGSAEAAGKTFGGQLQILQNRLDETKQKIGTAVLPILNQFLGIIEQNAMPLLDRFSNWFQSTAAPALDRFGQILSATVVPAIKSMASNSQILQPVLIGLGAVLAAAIVPAVWSMAAGVIAATWPALALGAAVAGLVAIFNHFYTTNAGFKAFVDGFVNGLKQAWSIVQANFMPVMQQLGGYLSSTFGPVLQSFGALWKQLVPLFGQLWQAAQPILKVLGGIAAVIMGVLVGALNGIIKAVAAVLQDLAPFIGGIVQMFTGLVQLIGGQLKFFKDLFTLNFSALGNDLKMMGQGILNIFGGLFQSIGSLVHGALSAVGAFIGGFVQGIVGFFQWLFDKIVGHSIIPDMINGILQWIGALPGKALAFIGNLVSGMIQGFLSLQARVTDTIRILVAAAIALVSGWVSNLLNMASNLKNQFVSHIQDLANNVKNTLVNGFNNLKNLALSWGSDLIQNFISGIQNMLGNLGNAMQNVGNTIKSFLHFSKPDTGPLVDVESWMPDFMNLLSDGVNSNLGKLSKASLNIASTIKTSAQTTPSTAALLSQSVTPAQTNAQQLLSLLSGSGQPVILQIDGRTFARLTLPHIVDQVRYSTGIMSF